MSPGLAGENRHSPEKGSHPAETSDQDRVRLRMWVNRRKQQRKEKSEGQNLNPKAGRTWRLRGMCPYIYSGISVNQ